MGGEWEGTERVNLEFSEAWERIKLKVVFELKGIYKCKKTNKKKTSKTIN